MRAYQDMVFSTAVRLTGNRAQAEDIAQEVFLKAFEHYERIGPSPTAGGWLKTVATHLSLNYLQRTRWRWRFFSDLSRSGVADDSGGAVEWEAPDPGVMEKLNAEERREWVDDALALLPDHQRVPLVLFHFEELPYQEIARRLGISLAKVKTDILRGRSALARHLVASPHFPFDSTP